MAHEGNPAVSSQKDTSLEGTSHRYSEVVLASGRKSEQERELSAQQADCTEQDWQEMDLAEIQARQEASGESSHDDWLVAPRVGRLLPMRPDTALQGETVIREREHAPETQTFSSDRRLVQLENQRSLLWAMLATLLGGAVALYSGVVRPETVRQQQLIAQLHQANAEQRSVQQREWGRLTSRISALDAQYLDVQSKLNAMQRPEAALPKDVGQSLPLQQATHKEAVPVAALKGTLPRPAATDALPEKAPQSATSLDTPSPTTPNEAAIPATSDEATPLPTPLEVPRPPSLREAMKAVTAKEAKQSATAKETQQPSEPTEPAAAAKPRCDKNDPLCGDLG